MLRISIYVTLKGPVKKYAFMAISDLALYGFKLHILQTCRNNVT